MSGKIQVDCPCCKTKLVVDAATGTILSEERPKADPTATFEQAMTDVKSGPARREDAFSKAFDRTKNLDDLLQKKFVIILKHALSGLYNNYYMQQKHLRI